jgi:hypothetical protein
MSLPVSYCNQALLLIGSGAINSFDDGTDLATICATLYPTVRDQLLVQYPWNFTLTKARLVQLTATPLAGWRYAYALPADLLNLRALFDTPALNAAPTTDWQLFDGRAFTNHQALYADYQRDAPEEAFPPHFLPVLKYALAAEFAVPVTEQATVAELYARRAFGTPQEAGNGGQMRIARTLDAQQKPAQVFTDFQLHDARFGTHRA